MDIEGAAMEVLNNILQEKIFPGQIIVEFEYSETDKINEQEFKQWSKELSNIVNKFKDNGYKCYNYQDIVIFLIPLLKFYLSRISFNF